MAYSSFRETSFFSWGELHEGLQEFSVFSQESSKDDQVDFVSKESGGGILLQLKGDSRFLFWRILDGNVLELHEASLCQDTRNAISIKFPSILIPSVSHCILDPEGSTNPSVVLFVATSNRSLFRIVLPYSLNKDVSVFASFDSSTLNDQNNCVSNLGSGNSHITTFECLDSSHVVVGFSNGVVLFVTFPLLLETESPTLSFHGQGVVMELTGDNILRRLFSGLFAQQGSRPAIVGVGVHFSSNAEDTLVCALDASSLFRVWSASNNALIFEEYLLKLPLTDALRPPQLVMSPERYGDSFHFVVFFPQSLSDANGGEVFHYTGILEDSKFTLSHEQTVQAPVNDDIFFAESSSAMWALCSADAVPSLHNKALPHLYPGVNQKWQRVPLLSPHYDLAAFQSSGFSELPEQSLDINPAIYFGNKIFGPHVFSKDVLVGALRLYSQSDVYLSDYSSLAQLRAEAEAVIHMEYMNVIHERDVADQPELHSLFVTKAYERFFQCCLQCWSQQLGPTGLFVPHSAACNPSDHMPIFVIYSSGVSVIRESSQLEGQATLIDQDVKAALAAAPSQPLPLLTPHSGALPCTLPSDVASLIHACAVYAHLLLHRPDVVDIAICKIETPSALACYLEELVPARHSSYSSSAASMLGLSAVLAHLLRPIRDLSATVTTLIALVRADSSLGKVPSASADFLDKGTRLHCFSSFARSLVSHAAIQHTLTVAQLVRNLALFLQSVVLQDPNLLSIPASQHSCLRPLLTATTSLLLSLAHAASLSATVLSPTAIAALSNQADCSLEQRIRFLGTSDPSTLSSSMPFFPPTVADVYFASLHAPSTAGVYWAALPKLIIETTAAFQPFTYPLSIHPAVSHVHARVIAVLLRCGEGIAALKGLAHDAGSISAHNLRAQAHVLNGQFQLAVDCFETVASLLTAPPSDDFDSEPSTPEAQDGAQGIMETDIFLISKEVFPSFLPSSSSDISPAVLYLSRALSVMLLWHQPFLARQLAYQLLSFTPTPPLPLRTGIWRLIYSISIHIGDYDAAHTAIVSLEDPARQTQCLRSFVLALVGTHSGRPATTRLQALFGYSFTDTRLVAVVVETLLSCARAAPPPRPRHPHDSPTPSAAAAEPEAQDYYMVAYSFLIQRGAYVEAASVAYEKACRYAGLTGGQKDADHYREERSSLLAALSLLRLVPQDSAWFVTPPLAPTHPHTAGKTPKRKSGYGTKSDGSKALGVEAGFVHPDEAKLSDTPVVVGLALLEELYAVAQANHLLVLRGCTALTGFETRADTVSLLLQHGLFDYAVSLCKACRITDLSPIFDALTLQCLTANTPLLDAADGGVGIGAFADIPREEDSEDSDDESVVSSESEVASVNSLSSPDEPMDDESFTSKRAQKKLMKKELTPEGLWMKLAVFLDLYDGPSSSYRYHAVAARRCLVARPQSLLPHWLQASFKKKAWQLLLNVYLQEGALDDAVALVLSSLSRLVSSLTRLQEVEEAPDKQSLFVPFTLIDLMRAALNTAASKDDGSSLYAGLHPSKALERVDQLIVNYKQLCKEFEA